MLLRTTTLLVLLAIACNGGNCPTNEDDWKTGNGIGNLTTGCTPACDECADTQHKVIETPALDLRDPPTLCPNRVCAPKTLEACPSDGSKGEVAAPPAVPEDTCHREPYRLGGSLDPCHCQSGWTKTNIDFANDYSRCYICVKDEASSAASTSTAAATTTATTITTTSTTTTVYREDNVDCVEVQDECTTTPATTTTTTPKQGNATAAATVVGTQIGPSEPALTPGGTKDAAKADADAAATPAPNTTGQTTTNDTDPNAAPIWPGQSKRRGGGGGSGTAAAISIPALLLLAVALIAVNNNNAANPVYEPPMAPPQRQGPVPPAAASASQSGPNYEEIDDVVDARTGTSSMQLADVEYAVAAEDGQQQYQPPPLQQLVLDGDGYVEGGRLPAASDSGLAVYAQPSASAAADGELGSNAAADEDEVILRAGTRFLITSIKLWKHGITEVRMAEVDSVSNVADEPVAYNEIDHYMALDPEVEVIYAVAAEMVGAAQDSSA
eukprot:gene443-31463_t